MEGVNVRLDGLKTNPVSENVNVTLCEGLESSLTLTVC